MVKYRTVNWNPYIWLGLNEIPQTMRLPGYGKDSPNTLRDWSFPFTPRELVEIVGLSAGCVLTASFPRGCRVAVILVSFIEQ